MKKFAYQAPTSVEQVIPLLDAHNRPLAGGTDLMTLLKVRLIDPEQLVSLRHLDELNSIEAADGGLRIGARATLSDLDKADAVRNGPYAALAQAARSAASPQLRNVATIGGNLLQESRCWYYRGSFDCWLKGGSECYARGGEHHYHAMFEQSACVAVQPSDPATALLALDAHVVIQGGSGERQVPLIEVLQPPTAERRRLHTLAPDELITAIALPGRDGWHSVYHKAMERAVYAFALAGVAVAVRMHGATVAEARIVLGAVANTPLLAESAAASLVGQPLSDEAIAQAAELAVADAQPLPQTSYKVSLVRRLVGAALGDLA